MPSRDGKRLFAVGDQENGRLVRYDAGSKQFVPFLSDLSAEGVVVSPDGRSVAYSAFPDATLWRSGIDGAGRVQLTSPPMRAGLPRWSPDGTQIAFTGQIGSQPFKVFVVSQRVARRSARPTKPRTRPIQHGHRTVAVCYARAAFPATNLRIVDLSTRQVAVVPGSKGLWSPRWSPDGRRIVAMPPEARGLRLYSFDSGTWTDLVRRGSQFLGWMSGSIAAPSSTGRSVRRPARER